jgi:hypothetical protein
VLVELFMADWLPTKLLAGRVLLIRKLRVRAQGEPPQLPSLMDTLSNLAFLGTTDTIEQAHRHADLLITPHTVGALEFHMLDSLREAGRSAALEALESAPAVIVD